MKTSTKVILGVLIYAAGAAPTGYVLWHTPCACEHGTKTAAVAFLTATWPVTWLVELTTDAHSSF